ncbi:MAG TPA: SDR family oxidoreductase [Verrucomicrobiae bacterium]
MPKVWVTGAGGLIGNYLVQTAPHSVPGWEVVPITRSRLDLTDTEAVRHLFNETKPQLIIHCAGLTQTGPCQKNPQLAHTLNVEVTSRLAECAADTRLFFFSTDLVFDGTKGNYVETDPVNPLLVYAETKAAAERIVLQNPRHTVIRTALNGGISPKRNRGFNEELKNAWEAGRTTPLFVDEFRCPIPAAVTARAVWELGTQDAPGLYHLGGSEKLSRWEIGNLLAKRWPNLTSRIEKDSIRDFKGLPRSPDVSMNCAKIQKLLSFQLPGLSEWLEKNPQEPF